ncbi:hypothetical protein THOM_1723 [Trachipleistophora hominis]|uniref:Uncharacterized protein n=1 Tax=Trachipleistophora hominis TaxID=72359 RepID=L7JX72_TRAHO|nr:hypothetical protein THOM_1723 [Trachipleistophora hominis]
MHALGMLITLMGRFYNNLFVCIDFLATVIMNDIRRRKT